MPHFFWLFLHSFSKGYQGNNVAVIDLGQIFFFGLMSILIFFRKTFSIFAIFNPPNLNILGFLIRLIIVDSNPMLHLPPSKIYLTFDPNSSFTSEALTALNPVEIFALGAANG